VSPDQHAAVNTFQTLVHTARHTTGELCQKQAQRTGLPDAVCEGKDLRLVNRNKVAIT